MIKILRIRSHVWPFLSCRPLCHSGQMHFIMDVVAWGIIPNRNISLTVIVSMCSARTYCDILLPGWSSVYLPSFPLPLFPLLQCGTLLCIVSVGSVAAAEAHCPPACRGCMIIHHGQSIALQAQWPEVPAQSGNERINVEDMPIHLATSYQNENT